MGDEINFYLAAFFSVLIWKKDGLKSIHISGIARAFPCGRLAHPEGQNEEENE